MKVNILMNVKSDRHIHAVASFHPLRGYTQVKILYTEAHPPLFKLLFKIQNG